MNQHQHQAATILEAQAGRALWHLGALLIFKALGAETNEQFWALEGLADQQMAVPLHVHSRDDECFYVVDGAITVRCGDQRFEAGPGSLVFLPRGIPHEWDVIGGDLATVLIITVPAGLDDFLRDYHAAGAQPNDVKDQIAAKYGITFLRDGQAAQIEQGASQ